MDQSAAARLRWPFTPDPLFQLLDSSLQITDSRSRFQDEIPLMTLSVLVAPVLLHQSLRQRTPAGNQLEPSHLPITRIPSSPTVPRPFPPHWDRPSTRALETGDLGEIWDWLL